MGQLICLVIGIILLIAGIAIPNTIALVLGIILCALGGLFVFILDGDWFD